MNTTNPYAPPQAAVQDIVDSDSQERAGRGIRLLTVILDGLVLAVMFYVPLGVSVSLAGRPLLVNAHFNYGAILGPNLWLPLLGLAAWLGLTVMFVSRNGQSIGKKITGIKVVRSDGSPASLGRIIVLRNVLNSLLGIIPLYGLVDALMIFGDKRQCVHDRIADTIVIKA
jgi:uncharacterized RDD family membrane protein YckC